MALAKPPKVGEAAGKFKINPEVNARLEKFMKDEPGLVDYVKQLPREQLERKFLLSKMRATEQQQGYTVKVRAWLEKPEQADLLKSLTASVAPNMKPEKQDQAVTNMAKNYIRTNRIKLG